MIETAASNNDQPLYITNLNSLPGSSSSSSCNGRKRRVSSPLTIGKEEKFLEIMELQEKRMRDAAVDKSKLEAQRLEMELRRQEEERYLRRDETNKLLEVLGIFAKPEKNRKDSTI